MSKYCCFCCPTADYSEKALDDPCPTCGRQYGFPLFEPPAGVQSYMVVAPLGRGFYAATYVAERGALRTKSVLKVSPRNFFEFFPDKDFESECQTHATVAEGTEHIVGIRDMFDADVTFGDILVPCHVAELEYVDGRLLADYLKEEATLSATSAAQIAIDLFKIRDELQKKGVNHNDLHAQNIIIEALGPDARRAGAIDDSIRAVAIDLGSISDVSKSDSDNLRLGDLHWIATHLNGLVGKLLRDPDDISDLENRLASALQLIAQSLSANAENQRTPGSTDFVAQIEEAYYRVTQHWRPWRESLSLRAFNASYNAQTMQAWHVPHLLVDPDGQWLNGISSPGPQIITGMRGCGKTMLLRALQFHARAAQREAESNDKILQRLKADNYVGLFVSAQRLLDRLGDNTGAKQGPFARLFVAFGLEAVRAVHHLLDIDEASISRVAHKDLAEVIAGYLTNSDDLSSANSAYDLENRLNHLLISLSRGANDYSLTVHPNTAFPALAEAIRCCSPIWRTAQVLFLLDDVSTRYLNQPRIEELLSALMFQDPSCAFKLTSEAQTIELGLKSPGEIHLARVGRDLSVFDLGAEVYEKIKKPGKGNGRDFVEAILEQRAKHFVPHPQAAPGVLLDDVPLETIAIEIGETARNSSKRKEIYRGITALARMCVGDIGDVISLYEQILKKAAGQPVPITAKIQSECFQDFCARRLYDLNRRGGFLKDVAKSFAEASHELLVKSCNRSPSTNGKRRIRQYSSLYVRITTGDLERQTERLRELIDAGVFVFAGGSTVPRTKTRDSNPMQQFKLTYRKIYGLVNFIGLAERDRFELSGSDLEEWLAEPGKGKEILLRNLGGDYADKASNVEDISSAGKAKPAGREAKIRSSVERESVAQQVSIFEFDRTVPLSAETEPGATDLSHSDFYERKRPMIDHLVNEPFSDIPIDWILAGFGFEKRTLESVRRLCQAAKPRQALTVQYREPGRTDEIKVALAKSTVNYRVFEYTDVIKRGLPEVDGNVVVDITGLTKPVIFHAIRNELRRKRRVWICHTEAQSYYPLDADLERVLTAEANQDQHVLLEELRGVLTGEEGPYESDKLLPSDSDETRQRVLCAFSSPKHERLLSLLDKRDYDRIEIVGPRMDSPRSKVAQIAAEVAARNNANSNVTRIDSNDLDGVLAFIIDRYMWCYLDRGLNFEFGLTGSKLQAVACAATSAAFKISQCWYLRPEKFDRDRFTKGVGKTHYYKISLEK